MASSPPTGNITRNITVKVAVQGSEKAISALAGLERAQAASLNAQRRAAGVLSNSSKAAGDLNKQLKSNRIATVQAGQQIQDFAIQVQGGISPLVAFGQQASQLGFVLQGASGIAGQFGRFLAGPWGTAFIVAVSAITPLVAALREASKETEKFPSSNLDKRLLDYAKRIGATADDVQKLEKRHVTFADRAQAAFIVVGETARREFPTLFQVGTAVIEGLGKAFVALGKALGRAVAFYVAAYTNIFNKLREIATPIINFLIDGFNSLSGVMAGFMGQNASPIPRLAAFKAETISTNDVIAGFDKLLGDINTKAEDIAFDRLSTQLKGVEGATKGAADAAKELNNEMAEWLAGLEDAADPMRVYLREVVKLRAAYDAGLLSAQAYRLEQERLLNVALKANRELGQSAAVSADIVASGPLPSIPKIELPQIELPDVRAVRDWEKALSDLGRVGVDSILDIGDAFADAISGAQSFADAMEQVGRTVVAEITKILVKLALLEGLKLLFPNSGFVGNVAGKLFGSAKGNVFENGQRLTAYATGGIVSGPTLFPMRSGVGLMGEAGPEAIMPLRRGADGKLGVGAPSIVINNYAGVGVEARETERGIEIELRAAKLAEQRIVEGIMRGGSPVSRAIEGAYGSRRRGV